MSPPINDDIRQCVTEDLGDRCGYCLTQKRFVPGKLEIDHIKPRSKGGTDDESNLCVSCRLCNGHKSNKTEAIDPITKDKVPLFNPRTQIWTEHFQWSADGIYISGITPIGRATEKALQLNDEDVLDVRRSWVAAGWHPPSDSILK